MIEKEIIFDATCRPGLAYQHAFDWLAVNLYPQKDRAALIAEESWQTAEILRRVPTISLLDPAPRGVHRIADQLGVGQPVVVQPQSSTFSAIGIIAASPQRAETLEKLKTLAHNDLLLYLILEGRLARFMAEHASNYSRYKSHSADLEKVLKAAGFQPRQRLEIQGLKSTAQHYLGEIAAKTDRFDLRDRRHFAMRRDYVSASSSSAWSTLVCLALERRQ